ncbi:pseudouridine synthase [Aggregicoccus sp. 17bor-14]|uniref:pseudouridine synthase n=1 Tax=Myxococcaceae TaxID=31 RepID=UPI00129C81E5|nr:MULTISPECIES: pseudouridine synthase [Myxococcaceae]MRI86706.1 pseudouridine synthase [Aggregicoccus sp. 17bor-14]
MAERLQKYLARAGVASRRHAEELITAGRVKVNNQTITELGSRVEPGTDLVSVDGKLVQPPEKSSYYLLYKPTGVVTTLSDPQGRPTVADYIADTDKRLFPVGRLDYDAEGALLFTDDGALAHKLTHPSFQVPRTYLTKVKGVPDTATLEKLRGGVRLEDGMATPVSVDVHEKAEANTWLRIVVAEGRPHLIKRLCAAVGHPVLRLYRPNYAGVNVEGLRPGQLRTLTGQEIRLLNEVAEGRAEAPNPKSFKLPPRRHGRAAPGFETFDGDDGAEDGDEAAPPPARRPAAGAPARGRAEGGSRPAFSAGRRGLESEAPVRKSTGERAAEALGRGMEEEARPARKSFGGGERPARKGFGAGGDRPARGGFGGGSERPARKSFGGDERPSRGGFGGGSERPARKSFGGDERPARKSFGGDERPARKSFGGNERPSRGGFGGSERKSFGGGSERPARGGFGGGAERKSFGGSERPSRGGDERPGRRGFEGGSERPARKSFGGGDERPARKSFGAGDERPARKSFGGGDERPTRRAFAGDDRPARGGAERPTRRAFAGDDRPARGGDDRPARKPFGGGAGRGGFGSEDRPARRSFGGAPERAPRGGGERGERPARGGSGGGERPQRGGAGGSERPARKGFGAAGGRAEGGDRPGFTDWRERKSQGPARWTTDRPRPGGNRPRPGGPRKPR